ncbi:hypothetical protein [Streptomyces sp. NBC_01518]|uniref:hypothetical protein n=1 Tax=Streptomyces sp. NBC_01518 TaxID=2903891 RepID=UPI003866057A
MSEQPKTRRPCLVCDEGADAHDPDPRTAEHVYEPETPTPDEAATVVAWVRETHGTEAAREVAQDITDPGWQEGDRAAVELAAEPAAGRYADAN